MSNTGREAQLGPAGAYVGHHDREGARQPKRFDPARSARLDDPARLDYLSAETVLELLDAPLGATVLDFGAGTGFYVDEYLRLRPDLHVIAIDEQHEMLAALRRRAWPDRFVVGGPDLLTSVAGDVQRVVALNVLHEIGDDDLRRLVHLVGSGVPILFIDWNAAILERPGPPAAHVYDTQQALERLQRLGLSVTRQAALTYHYAITCEVAR